MLRRLNTLHDCDKQTDNKTNKIHYTPRLRTNSSR